MGEGHQQALRSHTHGTCEAGRSTCLKTLETGRGFRISEPPDAKPSGLMSKRDVQSLKRLLPKLGEGEILRLIPGLEDSEAVQIKEALEAIRQAQKEGRSVWLVVGKAEGRKAKT